MYFINFVHMRWNNLIYSLLFSGLGAFSYLFLVNNTDLNEYLVLSNPIHPKKSATSSGVGLQNLTKRCKLMTGKHIITEHPAELFTVKVPLLYE